MPARISYYVHYKMWGEITYPFPNVNCATVEVWEWIAVSSHSLQDVGLLNHVEIQVS